MNIPKDIADTIAKSLKGSVKRIRLNMPDPDYKDFWLTMTPDQEAIAAEATRIKCDEYLVRISKREEALKFIEKYL